MNSIKKGLVFFILSNKNKETRSGLNLYKISSVDSPNYLNFFPWQVGVWMQSQVPGARLGYEVCRVG